MTKPVKLSGSVTVEAAMIVPLFFLLLIPFLYLMRQSLSQAILEFAIDDALKQMAVESYAWVQMSTYAKEQGDVQSFEENAAKLQSEEMNQASAELDEMAGEADSVFYLTEGAVEDLVIDLGGALYLRSRLLKSFQEEELISMGVENGSSGISFAGSHFFYEEAGHSYLLQAVCSVSWESPFVFFRMPDTLLIRTGRCFTGTSDPVSSTGHNDDGETQLIYVYRIGQGSHYHQKSCYLIQKTILSLSRQEAVGKGLIGCERCRPDDAGTQVVYMTDGGYRYHTGGCSYLFPDLQEMTEEEAIAQGLVPCGLCIGGQDYFK